MAKPKILAFKSIEPFFSQERDGIKPFTVRQVDKKDARFRALVQLPQHGCSTLGVHNWAIRSTNPATGEGFIRELLGWSYFPRFRLSLQDGNYYPEWVILYLCEKVG